MTQTVDTVAPAAYPHRWRALWVTLVAGFMTLLDVSIVAVALPSLRTDLGASAAQVQWVVSGYALAFGLALVTAGRLGDAYGRRRMFLIALAGFVLSSAAVGAAPTITLLIVARLVQGIAAGCLAPQNSGLIQQMFPAGAERGRAFGVFGFTLGVSTAVGPVIGGLILAVATGADGWRWIFLVNVPIGVVAFALAARLVPRDTTPRSRPSIDVIGALLLGGGVLAALLPLVQAEAGGLRRLWWLFGVTVVLLAAFARWETRVARRGGSPLLEPRLLTSTPGYASGVLLGTVYFIGYSGVFLVLVLYLQTAAGYSPLASGLSLSAFAAGSAVSALLGGRLVGRFGRSLTVAGLSTSLVGLVATALVLAFVPGESAGMAAAPALLVAGIGAGFVITPNVTMSLRNVEVDMAGAAGGALQTGQRMAGAVGTALLPGLYYVVLSATGGEAAEAAAVAVGAAAVGVLAAWVIGVIEWRGDRRRREGVRPDLAAHLSNTVQLSP